MTVRVNIRHRVNNAAIKRETRNGREVIVVPSAVAKFNTVLNDIFYSEQALRESYEQINDLPAPLGHPRINNEYVSARKPEAINQFWAGAWNTNARIDGDRVMADKVIDVEYAKGTENGRQVLNAIEKGEPISTSTGLLMERDPAPEGAEYNWIGTNFIFDHDAILLNEEPAIGTEQGVGMMVNGRQVEVINTEMPDDDTMDVAVDIMMDSMDYNERKRKRVSMKEKLANMIKEVFATEEAPGLNVNSNEDRQMTPEELQAALDKQAETLNTNFKQQIDEAVRPLKEHIDALNADAKAKAEAEHAEAVQSVVNAKLMDEAEAKDMPTKALNALLASSKRAAPLAPGLSTNSGDDKSFDTLPE